ncbi:hypothetical protein KPH14_010857 [Odynerus spinipes]|uniref:E3 SUMO-protein ligase NSE2 n=1 Tax=Odynerus spinipes TaxID=1348599 RepID=A0AAD9VM18_9HYME|nr:hypothetical protein KPH14_010857 [Odynerus spinipes]
MTQSTQVAEELFECYAKTAANIVLYFQGEKKMLDNLKDVVQKNCEIDAKLSMIEEIKQDILNQHDSNEITEKSITPIIKDYERAIDEINVNVSENGRLLEFNQQVKALLNDANKNQASVDSNDDEELQFSGLVNVIDPISKTRIKDPIKNTVCGHTYDRENIMSLLKVNRKTRCPMVGCKSKQYIEIANLQTDVAMKAYLQRNPA